MGRTARERLAKLLDDAQASGAFSAQILAPADALQVEVDGVGAVHQRRNERPSGQRRDLREGRSPPVDQAT